MGVNFSQACLLSSDKLSQIQCPSTLISPCSWLILLKESDPQCEPLEPWQPSTQLRFSLIEVDTMTRVDAFLPTRSDLDRKFNFGGNEFACPSLRFVLVKFVEWIRLRLMVPAGYEAFWVGYVC